MTEEVDWNEVTNLLDELYSASERLERLFPGRSFPLDGHLVGSMGEVIAAYMFNLDLLAASNFGHDAIAENGKLVEVKLTQGNRVSIRHQPEHLIALQRPKGGQVCVIYNGPGALAWENAGTMQKNGQRAISLSKLTKLNRSVHDHMRLPLIRNAPV